MPQLNIALRHIQKVFARPVLQDINLELSSESYVAILGKSGSGKSTLMNILGLIEPFDSGEFTWGETQILPNRDYSAIRKKSIGFIFQSYNLIPTLTCEENIRLPLMYENLTDTRSRGLMDLLEITPLAQQRVNTLSGGEKQRVAIARALILNPQLIIADEPTGNLDEKNSDIIFSALAEENRNGRGIVLITHDVAASRNARSRYLLDGGTLAPME
jgi:putative ABC transport system ATP-binding protein